MPPNPAAAAAADSTSTAQSHASRPPVTAVPENSELDDVSPFATAGAAPHSPSGQHKQLQPVGQKPALCKGLCSCCFRGVSIDDAAAGPGSQAHGAAGGGGGTTLGMLNSMRLSHRDSTKRPFLRKMGSMAYSDVEWFDALSKAEASADQSDRLAEVDQLSRQLSVVKHAGVPDPPLLFAGDVPLRFVPYPFNVSHFCGYWARDYDRSTPPPQPIDVMLGANWLTRKVHDSIPGALVQETESQLELVVKPGFVPPGLNRYGEVFDRVHGQETNWILRRDLKPGSSAGRIFLTVDGTIVVRVEGRGPSITGGKVENILEEYWRLEEGGNVLVARQCCKHVPSGKTAVQFLVGIRQPHAPKGWA